MAMSAPHLMSLIIAYGATHRAKILGTPEPEEMIGLLLRRTFEGLSHSLEDTVEAKSDQTLAAALLLASYAIISNTGDGPNSWKTHLQGAREIIAARGVSQLLGAVTSYGGSDFYGPQPVRPMDSDLPMSKELWFLVKVFAYIDVIGALSSSSANSVLTEDDSLHINRLLSLQDWQNAKTLEFESLDSIGEIDFLLGVDLQMIPLFAKVSALIRQRMEIERKRNDGLETGKSRGIFTD
jgi:hypothetical protein